MSSHIAIIGSGFSGTLVAINLLIQSTRPITISLVDTRGAFGPGLAYSPPSDTFKLNVKAQAMGALPSDPEGFFRWLKKKRPATSPDDFAPRSLYGEYLSELLELTIKAHPHHSVNRIAGEATDISISSASRGLSITLHSGATIQADHCVLAVGNLLKSEFAGCSEASVLRAPFDAASYADLPLAQNLCVIGSSLTAVDVILEAERQGFKGKYLVVSRHGRFPLPHETPHNTHHDLPEDWHTLGSVSKLLSLIRSESRRLGTSQPVFEAMRPHIQSMWRHLAPKERQRFLRHVQPLWDIHRHRIPQEHHNMLQELRRNGRLELIAGRITHLATTLKPTTVSFIHRSGRNAPATRECDALFLCVGPESDLSKVKNPLLRNLTRKGLIQKGSLSLGIAKSAPEISVIGPLQRENLWEITAVRELREEAARVAARALKAPRGI